jgi:acetolactate synthase-1/2/3 large subunit
MTVSDYIARFLAAQGIKHVFTLAGGMICPMLDAISTLPLELGSAAPRIVPMRHEQAAGFAAEGEARMTGIPGVVMATSGPGATNLLTAIASCYFDSVPAVFITGQVPKHEQRRGNERQRGFQETDIVKIVRPVTKSAWRITGPRDAVDALGHAWDEATGDRPGPVLLDIPFDVQRAELPPRWAPDPVPPIRRDFVKIDPAPLLAALREAKRPLALVGGGVRAGQATAPVRRLLSYLWIPTVHSLMGKDVLGAGHPLDVGMIGTYGNRWANKALSEADFLLVLGSRLDLRQLGIDAEKVLTGKHVFHVDVDAAELKHNVTDSYTCDLRDFCDAVAPEGAVREPGGELLHPWKVQIAEWHDAWPAPSELLVPVGSIHPLVFLEELGSRLLDAGVAAVVTDVGSHQMWAAQAMPVTAGIRFLTSGGHGAMGFGLPAAIGACLASGRKPVVLVTGDASLLVNVQELATVAELNLPIKIVVLDNAGHGMVREFQDRHFSGRHTATASAAPNLCDIVGGFGLSALSMRPAPTGEFRKSGRDAAFDYLFAEGPALLHVPIDPATPVAPRIPYGKGPGEMEPAR